MAAALPCPLDRFERIERAFISRYWSFELHEPSSAEPSLLKLLESRLSHIDPSSWERRLSWGGAYVNGIPAPEDRELPCPCRVEYYEPKFDLEKAHEFFPKWDPAWVVYEDGELLVSFKPAGLPCMPAREQQRFNLKVYLESHIGGTIHMPSRLDMSTQGIVIVSKAERMHAPLQRLFEERLIRKSYLFYARGACDWTSRAVEGPIGKHPEHPVLRQVAPSGGRRAVTLLEWVRRSTREDGSHEGVVQARPLTGRTHQIRVHASSVGLPIRGDNFYGGEPAPTLHLLSWRLDLAHPTSSAPLTIRLPETLAPAWAKELRDA